uniref:helix-turn-helix domain-containing protein n=1 Tax=Agathobacter sp. TaxID=2021311 RepID=UPI004056E87B
MVYERIRNLREDKDLTQTNIADYLHITQRTYSRYENDERAIPIEVLSKLADLHQTSVDYLIGRTNIMTPYPAHHP